MDRRKFLRTLGIAGAGAAIPWKFDTRAYKFMMARAYPFAQSPTNIRKFVTNLPGLGPGGANQIGQYLTLPTKTTQTFAGLSTDVYRLGVKPFGEKMHPDLKKSTHFWGYYDLGTGDQKYLGGVIVAKRGTPVLFNLTNQLPPKTLVPIDPTLQAGPNVTVGQLPPNRIVTHLHGGLTPWFSDGTPFQWFTPNGIHGPSFMNVPGTNPPPGTATYYYPMDQSARFVWYHDHAVGITRTNAYAGIASALIITDDFELSLIGGLLPDLVGIPLVIQDKTFVPANILTQDPSWQWGMESDLWYPHLYETTQIGGTGPNPSCLDNASGRWDYGPCAAGSILPNAVDGPIDSFYTLPTPASVVAEGFLDTTLVNGAPYPVLNVTDKTFRFRLLNGSQARFWHLNLYAESTTPGEPNLAAPGPAMVQVGTEGGFLPGVVNNSGNPFAPVFVTGLPINPNGIAAPYVNPTDVNPDGPFNLLLAPAERADILIDFTGKAGNYILYADAPAPFPEGDPRNDYFTGNPDFTAAGGAPSTVAGFGPNTRTIMKIVVGSGPAGSMANVNTIATALQGNFSTGNQPALLFNDGNAYTPKFPLADYPFKPPGVARRRRLTLNEDFDEYGRLSQRLGTDDNVNFTSGSRLTINGLNNNGGATWGRDYLDAVTESPSAGDIEIWDIYNFTGDTHPIHFHLVNVQIIQRQAFTGDFISGIALDPAGPFVPDDNELGWKETVRMNPAEVTTVILQFNLPTLPASMDDPLSPRTDHHEYVWHCHILEHEEHDMMRPLVVI